jgi:hypothetical protein
MCMYVCYVRHMFMLHVCTICGVCVVCNVSVCIYVMCDIYFVLRGCMCVTLVTV